MTLPFRFYRGEFDSGFYLRTISTMFNAIVTSAGGIYDEIMYHLNVQFTLLSSGSTIAMRTNDVLGIAAIAGVFPLYFAGGYWPGALFFTESAVFGGNQRSDRGLYNTERQQFEFVQTDADWYPEDIVTQSSPTLKMSLVPSGQVILGYTREDQPVYDSDGNIIWDNVYATPPVGVAYNEFYGPNFSTLSQDAVVISQMGIDFVRSLFIILQKIRYNGPTLETFMQLTETICEDAVIDISIVQGTEGGRNYFIVNYARNSSATANIIQQRITIWRYIITQKFKLYQLFEVTPSGPPVILSPDGVNLFGVADDTILDVGYGQ